MEKAYISFRIGAPQWLSDARFRALLDVFERNKGVTDEVTFFTSETHPPLPLEVIRQRAGILAQRMAATRAMGYRSGVNVLATLGHHNENLPNSLAAPYTRMTDPSGAVCQGTFCPNDEGMRGYIAAVYKAVAQAGPDYIWVDDDVRLSGHAPIRFGCFCDTCLALFAHETGKKFTRGTPGSRSQVQLGNEMGIQLGNEVREGLLSAFNQAGLDAALEIRNAWLEHNRKTMVRLLSWIEKTVHAVKPGLPLGFMTGERFYEGFDFDAWAGALAGPGKSEVLWRPGGGNYTDEALDGIAQKAHQIGRQIALLPASVVSIQSEVESFPYQRLRKSERATVAEAAAYVAAGCTGAAYNVLSMYDEPLDEYEPLVAALRGARPFLDCLARELGRGPSVGVFTGWSTNSFAAANAPGDWFNGPKSEMGTGHADSLYTLGIPPAYHAQHGPVTALTGDTTLAMTDAGIRRMLASGVYMDADALARLNAMGYGKLTGFTVAGLMDHDCIEQFTEDPLNGPFAGRRRDGRQSFWHCPAHGFAPAAASCRSLARIIDYASKETAPCGLGAFENELGGRICVAGYYPWTQLHNLGKSAQLKAVFRWLSRDALPAYVASFHRINLWARPRENGAIALALLNASLDPAKQLELRVLTPKTTLRVIDMQCRETLVASTKADGPYRCFTLPAVEPWSLRLAVVG